MKPQKNAVTMQTPFAILLKSKNPLPVTVMAQTMDTIADISSNASRGSRDSNSVSTSCALYAEADKQALSVSLPGSMIRAPLRGYLPRYAAIYETSGTINALEKIQNNPRETLENQEVLLDTIRDL